MAFLIWVLFVMLVVHLWFLVERLVYALVGVVVEIVLGIFVLVWGEIDDEVENLKGKILGFRRILSNMNPFGETKKEGKIEI